MFELEEKVCLITGAASGIGLACLKEFLKNGVKAVAIVDIDEQAGLKVLEEVTQEFGANKAIFVKTDVSDENQFEDAFKKTVEAFKHIDVLVNNASIFNDLEWKRMIEINLNGFIHGNLLGFEKYIPKYKSGNEGVIINIGSVSSINIRGFHPIYTAVKHGVLGLSRSFGIKEHYERSRVKVISVCPGATDTSLLSLFRKNCLNEHFVKVLLQQEVDFVKQPTIHVAKSVMEIIKSAQAGSVWVVENNEEAYEVIFPSRQDMRLK